MIDRIQINNYSISRKSVAEDGRHQNAHSDSKEKENEKKEAKEELQKVESKLYKMTLGELQKLVLELQRLEIYRDENFKFECIEGKSTPTVIIKSNKGKIIQELYPFQVLQIIRKFSDIDSSKKGSLLDIAC